MAPKRRNCSLTRSVVPYVFRSFKYSKFTTTNKPNDADRVPYARTSHQIVADERYLYLIGGQNVQIAANHPYYSTDAVWADSKPFFRELWRFSKSDHTWTRLPVRGDVPDGLEDCNAILWDGNQLLVYGSGDDLYDQFYVCNLKSLVWTRVRQRNFSAYGEAGLMDVPVASLGQLMVADKEQKRIYLAGGYFQGEHHLNVYVFNYKSRMWKLLGVTPKWELEQAHQSLIIQAMALHQRKLFIAYSLGVDHSLEPEFACDRVKLIVFDIDRKAWRTPDSEHAQGPTPKPRHHARSGQHGECLFLAGGDQAHVNCTDVWSLNLRTQHWTHHPSLSTPAHLLDFSMTISEQGELTIFDTFHKLDNYSTEVYSAYLAVPTLRLLARNALLHRLALESSGSGESVVKRRATSRRLKRRAAHKQPQQQATLEQLEQFLAKQLGFRDNLIDMPPNGEYFSLTEKVQLH